MKAMDMDKSGPGTNTGHGHVWVRPDGHKARCGGARECHQCANDLAAVEKDRHNAQTFAPDEVNAFVLRGIIRELYDKEGIYISFMAAEEIVKRYTKYSTGLTVVEQRDMDHG